jgi:hypothetical protein
MGPTVEGDDRSKLRELTVQGHSAGTPTLRQKLRPAPIRGDALEHDDVRRWFGRAENPRDHVRGLFLELRGDLEITPGRAIRRWRTMPPTPRSAKIEATPTRSFPSSTTTLRAACGGRTCCHHDSPHAGEQYGLRVTTASSSHACR